MALVKGKGDWVEASSLLDWAKSFCPMEPFAKELSTVEVKELERRSFNTGFIVGLLLYKWLLAFRGEQTAAQIIKEFIDRISG